MKKGIIYYTDNRLTEPIFSICQKQILTSGLDIVSVSLNSLNFGVNIVYKGDPGYPSMIGQIITALEASKATHVFFCEHDVLYHPSHFDFSPPTNDIYYYNTNNWRWDYPGNRIIKYKGLTSLSQLCANRLTVLAHFKARQKKMRETGIEKFNQKDPRLARLWGYEPGLKKRHNGAFLEEKSGHWTSDYPNIDIRHPQTFSLGKVKLKDFRHKPEEWTESTLDKLTGWDLKSLFK